MENASDALKMAFAIFILMLAFSTALMSFAQVKDTADFILFYRDSTNFYDYITGEGEKEGRIVGIDTVISALYLIDEDSNIIVIKNKLGTTEKVFSKYDDDSGKTLEERIEEFVSNTKGTGTKYKEMFLEIATTGVYITASDNTQLIKNPGTTQTYIIYTEQ